MTDEEEQSGKGEQAGEGSAFAPIEEKAINFYGDEIYAVLCDRGGEEVIYVPIKPISDALGLTWSGQYERIQNDDVLSEVSELIRVTRIKSTRGNPTLLCIPLEYLAGWLFGISTSRAKANEELKEKVRRYKRECYRVLARHFQGEALSRREESPLAQIRATALAVAQLAEQQMEMEGRVERLDTRMDKAAQVIAGFNRRLTSLEGKVSPASFITEEQATEVSLKVKA